MTKYEFNVAMTCNGCANAVRGVLSKTPGVTDIQIDVPTKTVVVTATASAAEVEAAIKKTGKATALVKTT